MTHTVHQASVKQIKRINNTRLLQGYAKISSNMSFLSKRYKTITNRLQTVPLQTVFKRVFIVYAYSNCIITKLLYY